MKEKIRLNGYHNYTVILTYIAMLTGFAGIIYAFSEKFYASAVCLMVAGVCDMFDGAVASTKERYDKEKRFGIQIDLLSDLICFGVLPGALVYAVSEKNWLVFLCSSLYVLCALIRLAYFNVCEEDRQKTEQGDRMYYTGFPVTSSALFFPLILIAVYFEVNPKA